MHFAFVYFFKECENLFINFQEKAVQDRFCVYLCGASCGSSNLITYLLTLDQPCRSSFRSISYLLYYIIPLYMKAMYFDI